MFFLIIILLSVANNAYSSHSNANVLSSKKFSTLIKHCITELDAEKPNTQLIKDNLKSYYDNLSEKITWPCDIINAPEKSPLEKIAFCETIHDTLEDQGILIEKIWKLGKALSEKDPIIYTENFYKIYQQLDLFHIFFEKSLYESFNSFITEYPLTLKDTEFAYKTIDPKKSFAKIIKTVIDNEHSIAQQQKALSVLLKESAFPTFLHQENTYKKLFQQITDFRLECNEIINKVEIESSDDICTDFLHCLKNPLISFCNKKISATDTSIRLMIKLYNNSLVGKTLLPEENKNQSKFN